MRVQVVWFHRHHSLGGLLRILGPLQYNSARGTRPPARQSPILIATARPALVRAEVQLRRALHPLCRAVDVLALVQSDDGLAEGVGRLYTWIPGALSARHG